MSGLQFSGAVPNASGLQLDGNDVVDSGNMTFPSDRAASFLLHGTRIGLQFNPQSEQGVTLSANVLTISGEVGQSGIGAELGGFVFNGVTHSLTFVARSIGSGIGSFYEFSYTFYRS